MTSLLVFIAPDKRGIRKIFLLLHGNMCCVYSLEAPHQVTLNEYPQHNFALRNKKNKKVINFSQKHM